MWARWAPVRAPDTLFEINGRPFAPSDEGFAAAVAEAHALQLRPRCLGCARPDGEAPTLYVARLGSGYILKRMPNTGDRHLPGCRSFRLSVAAQPELRHVGLRRAPTDRQPASTDDPSCWPLDRLLRDLWERAGLNLWRPAFAGHRNWATVRRRLLRAAAQAAADGAPLPAPMFVPETFFVAHKDEILARRRACWADALSSSAGQLLLIGELKAIVPAHNGFKVIVKHLPDLLFRLDQLAYHAFCRRSAEALSVANKADDWHQILIAAAIVHKTDHPSLQQFHLLPISSQWVLI